MFVSIHFSRNSRTSTRALGTGSFSAATSSDGAKGLGSGRSAPVNGCRRTSKSRVWLLFALRARQWRRLFHPGREAEAVPGGVSEALFRFGWSESAGPLQDEYYAPRYIERAVKEFGFKAAHLALHWFGMQPNDKRLYPIYEKCLELGVPIVMPLGAAPPRSGARSVAEPHLLDPVIGDFLELSIVGQSIGYPWERESVYLARNNANFSVLADSPAPEHWIADFVGFIKQGRFPKHDAGAIRYVGPGFPFKDLEHRAVNLTQSRSPTLLLRSCFGRMHCGFSNLAS